jgi:hypothetical protein
VFKKKSARYRSKPRAVSFQGREDDTVMPTATDNSVKVARYMAPARRCIIAHADNSGNLHQGTSNISVLKSLAEVQIVPEDEVKPTFRTPCRYFYVGSIKLLY